MSNQRYQEMADYLHGVIRDDLKDEFTIIVKPSYAWDLEHEYNVLIRIGHKTYYHTSAEIAEHRLKEFNKYPKHMLLLNSDNIKWYR